MTVFRFDGTYEFRCASESGHAHTMPAVAELEYLGWMARKVEDV